MRTQHYTYGFLFAVILVFTSQEMTLAQDPYAILDTAYKKYDKIIDYTADAEIRIDVDFIRIPDKHVKVLYKKPDKIKYKGDGFFMLPKKGLDYSMHSFLKGNYTAIYAGSERVKGNPCNMVKVLSNEKKPEIILTDLWIDTETQQLRQMESFSRKKGSFMVQLYYADADAVLPDSLMIEFDVEQFSLPIKFFGREIEMDESKAGDDGMQKGKVYIYYSNYVINLGLEDEVFEEVE